MSDHIRSQQGYSWAILLISQIRCHQQLHPLLQAVAVFQEAHQAAVSAEVVEEAGKELNLQVEDCLKKWGKGNDKLQKRDKQDREDQKEMAFFNGMPSDYHNDP